MLVMTGMMQMTLFQIEKSWHKNLPTSIVYMGTGYYLHYQHTHQNPTLTSIKLHKYCLKTGFDILVLNLIISTVFFTTERSINRIMQKISKIDKDRKIFSYMFENSKIPMILIDLSGNIIIGNTPFRNVLKTFNKDIK